MDKKAWSKSDIKYMDLAFEEAHRVRGNTRPNPAVGAVLVKNGRVVGRGGTSPAGGPHAEVNAITHAGTKAKGASCYVTLEPCCHFGKTPPCVDALISHGIKKVFIATVDKNKLVSSKGIKKLKKAGIEVHTGLLEEKAIDFYEYYNFFIKYGRPKIILKIAQSIDGSINEVPGKETAITGPEAKVFTHNLRAMVDGVMVGAVTLRADNPSLTPRNTTIPLEYMPETIITSKSGRLPLTHTLMKRGKKKNCVVISNSKSTFPSHIHHYAFTKNNLTVDDFISVFKKRGYHGVLIEGGSHLLSQWLSSKYWDMFYVLTGPSFLPKGQKWASELPDNWHKAVKFDRFHPVGKDSVLKIVPKKIRKK
ncbi:MAG: bifunctional diaminohydroxyphosphoribosylaminopyrimidine deaminase/5-amino-6-(5-phosphoribosylamino)uracil reductase RibD [Fibrobacteria bacterium]|nr:bifunctional diaminohydroxyphosphoribosylaminopyrimidine deaminase/5-amino-6-(5-phosphoribosylamino)uracil reductase RibD [Fibrobacteria bacterium]